MYSFCVSCLQAHGHELMYIHFSCVILMLVYMYIYALCYYANLYFHHVEAIPWV